MITDHHPSAARAARRVRSRVQLSGAALATAAVLAGLASVLALFGGMESPAEAQPIPCEQWQQMHPGWPCADVPTYNPQPQNTGVPAPIIPSLFNPPTQQGGGPGAGALTAPPLQGPPNMDNPIVPVPGYTPPRLPGNEQAPVDPGDMLAPAEPSVPGPQASVPAAPSATAPGTDTVSQLERAARLREQGALSDSEYATLKQRILQGFPVQLPPSESPTPPAPTRTEAPGTNPDRQLPLLAIVGAVAFVSAAAGRGSPLRHDARSAPPVGSGGAGSPSTGAQTGGGSPSSLLPQMLSHNDPPSSGAAPLKDSPVPLLGITPDAGGQTSGTAPPSTSRTPQPNTSGNPQPGNDYVNAPPQMLTHDNPPPANTVPLKDSPVPLLGITPDAGGQTPSSSQPSTTGNSQPGSNYVDSLTQMLSHDNPPAANALPLKDSPAPLIGISPGLRGPDTPPSSFTPPADKGKSGWGKAWSAFTDFVTSPFRQLGDTFDQVGSVHAGTDGIGPLYRPPNRQRLVGEVGEGVVDGLAAGAETAWNVVGPLTFQQLGDTFDQVGSVHAGTDGIGPTYQPPNRLAQTAEGAANLGEGVVRPGVAAVEYLGGKLSDVVGGVTNMNGPRTNYEAPDRESKLMGDLAGVTPQEFNEDPLHSIGKLGAEVAIGVGIGKLTEGLGRKSDPAVPDSAIPVPPLRPHLPDHVKPEDWAAATQLLEERALELGGRAGAQGSRVDGSHRPDSDIDFGIKVEPETFSDLLNQRREGVTPGSNLWDTLIVAEERGRLHGGEAGLRPLRKQLEQILGMEVDFSLIEIGGLFDNGLWIMFGDKSDT